MVTVSTFVKNRVDVTVDLQPEAEVLRGPNVTVLATGQLVIVDPTAIGGIA